MVRLAAIRLALDHLIGKPQISIDAVTTKVDVGALYLEALKRSQNSHAPPGEQAIDQRATEIRDEDRGKIQ
jgi:hypothetical protein